MGGPLVGQWKPPFLMHIYKNVGKKSQRKKSHGKKSQFWVEKKVTGKKVTKKNDAFSQFLVRNKHFLGGIIHKILIN